VASYLDRWARQLVRRGVRSGLIGGSNIWLSIGAIAWLFRFLSRRPPRQVSVERLRLGETILVSHVAAPPRGRRAKRKAARDAAERDAREAKDQAKREASRRYARAAAKDQAKHEASRRYARGAAKATSEGDAREPV